MDQLFVPSCLEGKQDKAHFAGGRPQVIQESPSRRVILFHLRNNNFLNNNCL
jgi:hypothetical protein